MATPTEWNLLKHQFDALVHDEIVDADSIEKIFDEQVRRRFAEIINRCRRPDVAGYCEELRDEPT